MTITSSILQQQAERKALAETKTAAGSDKTDANAVNPNANATGGSASVLESKEDAKAPAKKEPPAPAGGYKDVGLGRFMKADGSVVKPNAEGYFIPKSQEEADMLEHYADRNELVNRPVRS